MFADHVIGTYQLYKDTPEMRITSDEELLTLDPQVETLIRIQAQDAWTGTYTIHPVYASFPGGMDADVRLMQLCDRQGGWVRLSRRAAHLAVSVVASLCARWSRAAPWGCVALLSMGAL